MENFDGKVAVVTGGGSGMGRELCLELVKQGSAVATCDVIMENLEETRAMCAEVAPGSKVTIHRCDVSSEADVRRFRDEVTEAHGGQLNLLFNNAGIGGGGTMTSEDSREDWERTFNICWYGVYYGCRAFMPNLLAADEAHIVNTSSINGFWARLGAATPHTAYCAAKFAVKGFTEALITDLRTNAPHIGVSVVMPGHIGTSIVQNSGQVLGRPAALDMSEDDVRDMREQLMNSGGPLSEMIMNLSDDQIKEAIHQRGLQFRDNAPTSANQAATIILEGVKAGRWRILVGDDAHRLDDMVRAQPEAAYEPDFLERLMSGGDLTGLIQTTD